ncbi:FAD-binding oxidoreductase [Aspergillus tanneri]|uniref:FAD-binding PCMH-type domain-containing protein n=1 Tax=Aspergillus tanneri TaxID=1220188 RepID=A0A5M9MZA0_9EURO|nr:uncharacterized protein ATNIH1004_002894 [Aspergillus tanneri]KAA8650213.1 hypothetical protein ATNIH1004_002894 [Aspergillus tanneri]
MPFLSYRQALELKKELQETHAEVITPENENYAEGISRFSDPFTSTEEASKVVSFATKRYIPFVVQGGGYSTSGSSSTHGGIVISLSQMSKITVDPASRTVAAEGGAKWGDVDKVAADSGLAVVGCTVNHTSVGGTTLGGVYGWLTGHYSLIIDNLLHVRMVLADGSIVQASIMENPDLFWAVRGAGQSFGVATELVFKVYPQVDPVFGGLLYFTPDHLPQIIEFANGLEERATGNESFFFDVKFLRELYKDFDKILKTYPGAGENVVVFELVPYTELIKVPNNATAFANRGKYHNAGSIFCWHDVELDHKMQSIQQDLMHKIAQGAGVSRSMELNQSVGVYANYAGHA